MSDFELKIVDEKLAADMANGGRPLRSLCLKEAESFSDFLKKYARESGDREASIYYEGLADWEIQVVAGYIYQKVCKRF